MRDLSAAYGANFADLGGRKKPTSSVSSSGSTGKLFEKVAGENERKSSSDSKVLSALKHATFVVTVIGLVLLTLVQSIRCLEKYVDSPTYVSTEVVDQYMAEFPAMTICPGGNPTYRLEVLQKYGYEKVSEYNYHNSPSWTGNGSIKISAQDLFDEVSYRLWDILDSVTIKLLQPTSKGEDTLILKSLGKGDNEMNLSFQEKRHRAFGKCYTLYPEDWIRKQGINVIELKSKIPTKVYLHRPGQFLDLSGRMGYKIFLGDRVQTQINYQDVRMLPKVSFRGERSCSNDDFDDCLYGKVTARMYEEAGCTVPWILNNSVICDEPSKMNISHWLAWNRITNQRKDCLSPCNFLMINVGSKNHEFVENSSYSVQSLYFAPRVMQSLEDYLYPFLSLAAEIGGYVGLLLGVSFFHLATFIRDSINDRLKLHDENVVNAVQQIKTIAS